MVPPLHPRNVYIKTYLSVWRTQKFNRVIGAINALGVTALQIHPVSCTVDRAENGNLRNFEAVENNGTALAPKQCLYQNLIVGMDNTKM